MSSVEPPQNSRETLFPAGAGARGGGIARNAGKQVLRYSRLVARAKRILPLVAAAPIVIIVMWPYLSSSFARITVSFPAFDASQVADLRMVNPRYVGTDHGNHPFTVTAATAFQNKGNDELMALEQPKADFRMTSGASVSITGDSGLYQSQAHFLDLNGNVTLSRDKAYTFRTRSARVDLENDTAEGHEPISGGGPAGTITADGFRALHNGESVIFTGRAQLVVTPAGSDRP